MRIKASCVSARLGVFRGAQKGENNCGSIPRTRERLGRNPETLGNWLRRAEMDQAGITSEDNERIGEL